MSEYLLNNLICPCATTLLPSAECTFFWSHMHTCVCVCMYVHANTERIQHKFGSEYMYRSAILSMNTSFFLKCCITFHNLDILEAI